MEWLSAAAARKPGLQRQGACPHRQPQASHGTHAVPRTACLEIAMECEHAEESQALPVPDLDALVAGTVALMTAWADPCPQARLPRDALRRLLARKVASNLFFLQHHPGARPALRQSLAQAHAHWVGLAMEPTHPAPPVEFAEPCTPLPQAALH